MSDHAKLEGVNDMTLLDYFIAHAPSEPQPWFRPNMPTKPAAAPYISTDGERLFGSCHEARMAVGDDYESVNQDAIDQWNDEYLKQKYVQWPTAWAHAVMEARK